MVVSGREDSERHVGMILCRVVISWGCEVRWVEEDDSWCHECYWTEWHFDRHLLIYWHSLLQCSTFCVADVARCASVSITQWYTVKWHNVIVSHILCCRCHILCTFCVADVTRSVSVSITQWFTVKWHNVIVWHILCCRCHKIRLCQYYTVVHSQMT